MKCPIDGTDLVMADRQGIEIDYCPKCRGVWLDRGELDKILERSMAYSTPPAEPPARGFEPERTHEPSRQYGHGRPYHKKRKSWLGEILDFD
jgi:Zn-finger nucleic acid-binding protein